jgi:hypothetical protein
MKTFILLLAATVLGLASVHAKTTEKTQPTMGGCCSEGAPCCYEGSACCK